MKYLADTNILVNHLKGKEKIDSEKIRQGLTISIISFGELVYGAYQSVNKERSLKIIRDFLKDLSVEVLPLDQKIMLEYGKIKAVLETKGRPLDDFDLLIAATAKTLHFILLTKNLKHFSRIETLEISQ